MDASSSAYPIMSAFLFDEDLAKSTNLLKLNEGDDHIYDLYAHLWILRKPELKSSSLDFSIQAALVCNLSRKLIKRIFMPIVYGKTQHAATADIYAELSFCLKKSECSKAAILSFGGWVLFRLPHAYTFFCT